MCSSLVRELFGKVQSIKMLFLSRKRRSRLIGIKSNGIFLIPLKEEKKKNSMTYFPDESIRC